jgi:hypothetical protein
MERVKELMGTLEEAVRNYWLALGIIELLASIFLVTAFYWDSHPVLSIIFLLSAANAFHQLTSLIPSGT